MAIAAAWGNADCGSRIAEQECDFYETEEVLNPFQ
jgi:hypothetical protein